MFLAEPELPGPVARARGSSLNSQVKITGAQPGLAVDWQRGRMGWESSGLRRPEDVEFFSDVGEVFVAGGERGFAMGSEGGGKTVGIREFVLGA